MPINQYGTPIAPTNFFDPFYLVLGILLFALILLIIREVLLWYWRVNKIVNLLEDIKKNTSAARTISVIPAVKTEQPITQNLTTTPVQKLN